MSWRDAPLVEPTRGSWRDAPLAQPPAGAVPGSREYADWAAQAARAGIKLPQVSDPEFGGPQSSILDPLVQGVTAGWGDELRGAVQGGLAAAQGGDFQEAYNRTLDESRQSLERERRVNPVGSIAAEVAGAIPTMVAAGGQLAGRGANVLTRTLSNLGVGAAQGTAYGAGAAAGDLGDRAKGAGSGALVGGAAGVAVPAVTGAVSHLVANPTKRAVSAAPDAAAIKGQAQAGYRAANASGVQISPQASSILAHDLRAMLRNEGLILPNGKLPQGMGKLRKALNQLDQFTSAPMSMAQFQRLREAAQEVARANKPGQARIGAMMLDQIDDFVENLPDTAFVGSGGPNAAATWAAAKQDYARGMRTSAIEDAIYNAQMNPTGDYATRLRSSIGSLLRKHRKRGQGFSEAEVEAMERFVQGGGIGDLMRSFAQGGGLPSSIAGGVAAGPLGAAAGAGMSLGSRLWLDRAAQNAANQIRATVATPGGLSVGGPGQGQRLLGAAGIGGVQPALGGPRDYLSELMFGR